MTRLLRGAARLLQAQTACPAACGAPSTSGRALVPGTGATTIIAGSSVRQVRQCGRSWAARRAQQARAARCLPHRVVRSLHAARSHRPCHHVPQACSGWGAPLQRHFGSSSSSSSAPLWRRAALGGGGGGILAGAAAGSSGGSSCSLPAAAAAALRRAACPHSLQQARGLLGKPSLAPKKPNYQDHNTKKPKTTKIKTRG